MTKILLVEDDKSLREIYGVRLLAEGYDIVSAGDGEEALAMAIKERPQLIVSDVMMPKISGFDMLDILRSTTETKDIKVIMMTALSSEDQRARGEALGADRYLVKSQVGIEDVVRTVHDVLGDAPVAAPSAAQTFGTPAPSAIPRSNSVPNAPPRQPAPVYTTPTPQQAPVQIPAPVATIPQPQAPIAAPAPSGLPQPTAPFSTPRPANLGDRIIHPIPSSSLPTPDLGSLIEQELGRDTITAAATIPPAPAQPVVPQAPVAPLVDPTPIAFIPTPMPTTPVASPPATPQQQDMTNPTQPNNPFNTDQQAPQA
jgi:CheY-like chemotaxis protein